MKEFNEEEVLEVGTAGNNSSHFGPGTWYAIAAFSAWGVLPLYWKALKIVPAEQILAHRIFWSFIFVVFIATVHKRWGSVKEVLADRGKLLTVILNAVIISGNWFIYIWAVNSGHIVEASLGYYINPLLTVILGMVFLKERLNFWQLVALLLAFTGVVVITAEYGRIPWIAICLALTFAFYGLTKKKVNIDSLTALLLETAFAAPVALLYIIFNEVERTALMGSASFIIILLLMCSGIVTAFPLLWFAQAARLVPLSTIGFFQYLAPSISLFIGIFIFGEPFTFIHLISFTFIWSAVTLFSLSKFQFLAKMQPKFFKEKTSLNTIDVSANIGEKA